MNARSHRLILGVTAALMLVVVPLAYQRLYAGPRRELEAETDRYRTALGDREDEIAGLATIRKDLAALARTGLGSDEESTSAALRSALNEVFAHYKLEAASVSTRRPEGVVNPAATIGAPEYRDKAVKGRPDFFAVSATATGKGSLERALRVLATLDRQPWVHRIDRFSLTPVGKDREQVELAVELTSVFLPEPELRAGPPPERIWEPAPDSEVVRYRAIWEKNVFRAPPPVPAAPAGPSPTLNPVPGVSPAGPALGDYRVTGVVQGRSGAELWLVNTKTAERLVLTPGHGVLGAVFEGARGDRALVRVGEATFEVTVGATLADRKPAG
ncbi:MAG TPA: hypothetical protein VD963_00800 [Phycisphaerales bacterium]|nr:hypothetical protein [Phycisphaerales bacterium]